MLKKILIGLVVVVGVVVAVVSAQPGEYRVESSLSMKAPPDVIYEQVADFSKFQGWSPWEELDPDMKREIKGKGLGSTYYWNGNDDVGEGTLEIVEATPPNRTKSKLTFIRPFEDVAMTGFNIEEAGESTKVTWWIEGKNNFVAKAMGLFMDIPGMIQKDYDKGLGRMKPIVEKEAEDREKAAVAQAAVDDAAETARGETAEEGKAEAASDQAEEKKTP